MAASSHPRLHLQRNNNYVKQQEFNQKQIKYYLSFQYLTTEPILNNILQKISFLSPQETEISSGSLLHFGSYQNPDNPIVQREDDTRSLTFDCLPLNNHCGIHSQTCHKLFDFPTVKINISSDTGYGLICVRLCMINEKTSSSILLSRGILNSTHYKSHEHPEQLNIKEIYNI
ncbi:unnamed protein product [Rotaria sp. Silwood2]|nr:unnamed protein product [Rotaria sp. Silwood2]CAF4239482.1 unnamed protein product [Rotaria sp. Silwood2]